MDFGLLENQDSVIGDHDMHPEHAYEVSWDELHWSIWEKGTDILNFMKRLEGTAQFHWDSRTSQEENILDL